MVVVVVMMWLKSKEAVSSSVKTRELLKADLLPYNKSDVHFIVHGLGCYFGIMTWWSSHTPPKHSMSSKKGLFNRKYIFQPLMFRGHVSFPRSTLPETNIAPENRSLKKEIPIGNHHFKVLC